MLEKVNKVDCAVLKNQSRFLNECLFYFIFLRPQSIKEAKKTQQEAKKKVLLYYWFGGVFEKDAIELMGIINVQICYAWYMNLLYL